MFACGRDHDESQAPLAAGNTVEEGTLLVAVVLTRRSFLPLLLLTFTVHGIPHPRSRLIRTEEIRKTEGNLLLHWIKTWA